MGKKDEPDQQARMTKAFRQAAEEANALLAPVGELCGNIVKIIRKWKCMQKIMLMHQEKAQNLQLTVSGIRLKNRVNNKKR